MQQEKQRCTSLVSCQSCAKVDASVGVPDFRKENAEGDAEVQNTGYGKMPIAPKEHRREDWDPPAV